MNAVAAARKTYKTRGLGLFAEAPIEHPDLPGIGIIGGCLDFLASTVAGDEDIREHGDVAIPQTPYFIVVETKKSTTIVSHSSTAHLLAELLKFYYLIK